MVLIRNGPEIVLRCDKCGTEIRHVGYDPGDPRGGRESPGLGDRQRP
jgi:hypothetical protein